MSVYMPDLSEASCATPAGRRIFDDINPFTIPKAVATCRECPVARECRMWGILHEDHGVWGGLTRDQLRAERRRHRIRLQEMNGSWMSGRAPQRKRVVAS